MRPRPKRNENAHQLDCVTGGAYGGLDNVCIALGVFVTKKTAKYDRRLRIRKWIKLGTFAPRKRLIGIMHWFHFRGLKWTNKELYLGERAESKCWKLGTVMPEVRAICGHSGLPHLKHSAVGQILTPPPQIATGVGSSQWYDLVYV